MKKKRNGILWQGTINFTWSVGYFFHSFDDDSNKEINKMIFRNVQAVAKGYDISLIKHKIQFKW